MVCSRTPQIVEQRSGTALPKTCSQRPCQVFTVEQVVHCLQGLHFSTGGSVTAETLVKNLHKGNFKGADVSRGLDKFASAAGANRTGCSTLATQTQHTQPRQHVSGRATVEGHATKVAARQQGAANDEICTAGVSYCGGSPALPHIGL